MAQKTIQGIQTEVLINELSDVTISSAQEGDVLVRSGSQWINQQPPASGFAAATITLTTTLNSTRSTSSDANLVPNNLVIIPYNNEIFDTGGWFNSAQPGRLTVPSGVTKARFTAGAKWFGDVSTLDNRTTFYMQLFRNGAYNSFSTGVMYVVDSFVLGTTAVTTNLQSVTLDTGWIPVAAGEYYQIKVTHFYHTASLPIQQAWFSVEGRE